MKKSLLIGTLLLTLLMGCTPSENNPSDASEGVKLERNGDIVEVGSLDDSYGTIIKVEGIIAERNIEAKAGYLIVVNYEEDKTIIEVVSINGKIKIGEKLFTVNSANGIVAKFASKIGDELQIQKSLKEFTTTPKLLGDFNEDGIVDIQDFKILKTNYKKDIALCDIAPAKKGGVYYAWKNIYSFKSPDNKVDIFDFITFALNYNKNIPTDIFNASFKLLDANTSEVINSDSVISVELIDESQSSIGGIDTFVKSGNQIDFYAIPKGEYQLYITTSSYKEYTANVELINNFSKEVYLEKSDIEIKYNIDLEIEDGTTGNKIKTGTVKLTGTNNNKKIYELSIVNGIVEFTNVETGKYNIKIISNGYVTLDEYLGNIINNGSKTYKLKSNSNTDPDSPKVEFEDVVLEIIIKDILGIDDRDVTEEDVLGIEELSLIDIESLKGLEVFDDLKTLEISSAILNDLSQLEKLNSLTTLKITNGSRIKDISVLGKLTNLEVLELSGVQTEDISVLAKLTNLKTLILEAEYLKDSDYQVIGQVNKLEELTLFGYNLTDISFLEDLTELKFLVCELDGINNLDGLSVLTNLETLKIGAENVNDISGLDNLTKLKNIDLRNIIVSDIKTLENKVNLVELVLNNSMISDLSPIKNLEKLEMIWLDDTAVSDLSPMEDIKSLRSVTLYANRITSINGLNGLSNLEELFVFSADYKITSLEALTTLTKLKVLEVSKNNISSVASLADLVNMEKLNISYNDISDISVLEKLVNLVEFNYTGNNIEDDSVIDNFKKLLKLNKAISKDGGMKKLPTLRELKYNK